MSQDTQQTVQNQAEPISTTEHQSISLSRKELYGLFVMALTIPFISFASGIYIGKDSDQEQRTERSYLQSTEPNTNNKAVSQNSSNIKNTEKTSKSIASEVRPTKTTPLEEQSLVQQTASQSTIMPSINTPESSESNLLNTTHSNAEYTSVEPEIEQPQPVNVTQNNLNISTPEQKNQNVFRDNNATVYTSKPRGNHYIVQVGLFKDPDSAQQWRHHLNDQFNYWVIPRIYPDGAKRYSVILGFYKNRLEALDAANDYETLTLNDAYVAQLNAQQVKMTLANL